MKILRQRLLRGANLYARVPCLLGLIDLEDLQHATPSDLSIVAGRLHALMPTLRERSLAPLPPGAGAAFIVAQLTLELQGLAGAPAGFGAATATEDAPAQRRVICSYQIEHIAQAAFTLAVYLVDALAHGRPFDFATPLAQLQERSAGYRIDPATSAMLNEARARGIPVLRVTEHEALYQLGWGSRQRRFHPRLPNDTALMGEWIAQDRQLTRALLDEGCVPIPPGATVDKLGDALRVARRLGGRVVVMPCGAGSEQAVAECGSEQEVAEAFARAQASCRRVIVERLVEGPRYLVDIGSGLVLGDSAAAVPDAVSALCARAHAKIGLCQGAIEIVAGAGGSAHGTVVAVHAPAPCRRGESALGAAALPGSGFGADGDGRIPVIAVTGTNGKTTTALMIAHTTALAGHRTGLASTHGVQLGGALVAQGDCTGYWSHRAILNSPEVDVAVLETARGGILKRGLAFDQCTVGVVLNVSDDHIGQEGVATVEDLARVKEIVAACAVGAAVLNADDPYCPAMAQRLDARAELIYFSMDAGRPIVRAHLAGGGRAVVLAGADIVIASGARREVLMAARAIPCTLDGRARYNVANSLAAAAALLGAGYGAGAIAAGLGSFVSDTRSNPLRTNIVEVRGVTVIVDYAHNPAAYASLAQVARALCRGTLIGVVTSPGDRRDEELRHTGQVCAQGFDRLVVYESASRGRPYGEAATLIREAALAAAPEPATIEGEHDRLLALRRALTLCVPGDVLAYCGTSAEALVEALLPLDPEAARMVAVQLGEPEAPRQEKRPGRFAPSGPCLLLEMRLSADQCRRRGCGSWFAPARWRRQRLRRRTACAPSAIRQLRSWSRCRTGGRRSSRG
ncbi:MAG: Mur ligase family protein [Telluria sp.]